MDYQGVNQVTTLEPYYMPRFEEMVCKVGDADVLSKLDLMKGFHQVGMDPADRPKTAFICPLGKASMSTSRCHSSCEMPLQPYRS